MCMTCNQTLNWLQLRIKFMQTDVWVNVIHYLIYISVWPINGSIKGCDSNFEVKCLNLNVAKNVTSTLH